MISPPTGASPILLCVRTRDQFLALLHCVFCSATKHPMPQAAILLHSGGQKFPISAMSQPIKLLSLCPTKHQIIQVKKGEDEIFAKVCTKSIDKKKLHPFTFQIDRLKTNSRCFFSATVFVSTCKRCSIASGIAAGCLLPNQWSF